MKKLSAECCNGSRSQATRNEKAQSAGRVRAIFGRDAKFPASYSVQEIAAYQVGYLDGLDGL